VVHIVILKMSSSSTLDRHAIGRDSIGPSDDDHDIEESDCGIDSHQDVSGRNINPAKLTAMLRAKFGVGAYEIHVS
jgi:hypothetical protein